jgi:hypothetical protein
MPFADQGSADDGFREQYPMTRRGMLRGSAAGMLALAAGIATNGAAHWSKPPNIVFILADDLGYADVSCYGRPDLSTPNIDRLAKQGIRFLQAYANSAVCTATRTALITGRYQYRLRVGLEEPLVGNADVGLPPEHPTLPSLLKKAGYSSTLVGKWHLGASAQFRASPERLRTFLRISWRRPRLLLAHCGSKSAGSLGGRCSDPSSGILDRPARQPSG